MAAKKASEIQSKNQKANVLIYCGPSLNRGILQQYSVFKNGFPKHLEEHFNKCPAIKELFVSPDKLALIKTNMQKQGTRENLLFNQVLAYVGRNR